MVVLPLLLAALPLPQATEPDDPQPERRVIPARAEPGADTLAFATPQTNYVLEDAIVEASPRAALLFFDHVGAHRGTVLRNVKVWVRPGTLPLDRAYWGVRGYEMADTLLDRVEVTGFGRATPEHDEGHALYLNPIGDLTIVDGWIHHNGGQGTQLVNRPEESARPRGPAAGRIVIRRTRYHENGFNPDRGGFQLSIFGTGQDVVLEDVEFRAGFEREPWDAASPGIGSRGALVIEPEPWAPELGKDPWWRPVDAGAEDFELPFTQGRVELRGVRVRHRAPDRAILQLKGCRELVVSGCDFASDGGGPAPRIELDRPDRPGRDCGRIEWRGNRGDAVVYVRGQRRGLASEDFVVE